MAGVDGKPAAWTIWRILLNPGVQTFNLTEGARIVHVEEQERAPGDPCAWVWLDENAPAQTLEIAVVGTGHAAPSPDDSEFVGTFQQRVGLVWHVFVARRASA